MASFRAKYGSRMARTRADSGTIRCLRRVPWGPALPATRRARCCHWTLSRVKEQSSETRSPVSSNVQTISFSSTALARVGEPIGLFGPEGLADELVGHVLTRSGNDWPVRGRVGDPELGSLSSRAGYQAAVGGNSMSRPRFRPTWRTRSGRWKRAGFALLHRRRTRADSCDSDSGTDQNESRSGWLATVAPSPRRLDGPRKVPGEAARVSTDGICRDRFR